jgi:exonuclease SbcD
VLVPGDLFDSAAPTPEAERIVYRALLDLAATGASVVVLAGNHDSDRRLQAVEPVLELGHIVTRPVFARPDEGGVVEVVSRDGRERSRIACLPFLSQRWVVRASDLMDQTAADSSQQYAERIRRLIAGLASGFGPDTVNILAAHCMVDGATVAGSERLAHTIFEYAVPSQAFPATAHYVALGHLHRSQVVPGPCPMRYAGSPLQLDFGEAGDEKSVLVIEASAGEPASVTVVPLTAGRPLATVAGTLDELRALAPGLPDGAWVRATVREQWRVGLADDVRALFPDAVDVAVERPDADGLRAPRSARSGRPPRELFGAYLAEQSIDDEQLLVLFDDLLDEVST